MSDAHANAEIIWQNWQDGTVIDQLPDGPTTRADGYAAQALLETRSARPRVGWKIAATSIAGQTHIGVDGPLAGRLLAERMFDAGTTRPMAHNRMRVAEPEFAFRFARDLPPRADAYTTAEVLGAVESLHLTIELPDSRFADFAAVGGPALIADNACAHELIIGPAVSADWRAIDLSQHQVHCTVGARYTREGTGANVLGDPRDALAWCVNEVTSLGITMSAGELVTTGTCAVPLDIQSGDRVTADFGVLGQISVSLTP